MNDQIRVMNITNGDEIDYVSWDSEEEAQEWIDSQDIPEKYMIMEII